MMASVKLNCPHCGAEGAAFKFVTEYKVGKKPPSVSTRLLVLGVCSVCEEGVIFEYYSRGNATGTPVGLGSDPKDYAWHLGEIYPKTKTTRSPSHTTPEVDRFFAQALNALNRGDHDASGAMSRKVVDVSTQQLLKEDARKFSNIRDRIDELAKRGRITQDLRDWAHQIRLGGNDASHDEQPYTATEARELLDFTELYLTYVYTLPGKLAERKKRADVAKAAEKKKN